MSDRDEAAARQIAECGRDALVERLRPVFADTAAAFGEPGLDPRRLEAMVQSAADRAGGVLWRRTLAGVAMAQLKIDLAEAVDHPLVRRAQELLAVPAYAPAAGPAALAPPAPPAPRDPPAPPAPLAAPPRTGAPGAIRVAAVHLGGIDTLRAGARNLELRFSDTGLEVLDTITGETIGQLTWEDITAVQMPRARRSLLHRGHKAPVLTVRTDRGQAMFELPGLSEQQVDEQLAPILQRTRAAEDPS